MPVVLVPGTPHAEEVLKWEYDDVRVGDERGRRGPRVFVEFPKMLYRAGRNDRNQIEVLDQRIAGDADEQRRYEAEGFCCTQEGALESAKAQEREIAKLAANQAAQTRKMSEKAQFEAAAYEDAVPGHVAEIPAQPIKPRGRPRKGGSHVA